MGAPALALARSAVDGRALTRHRLLCALAPLAATLVLGATPARAGDPTVVYGIELGTVGDRDRLLVFARREAAWEVSEPDPTTVVLRLRDAVLDPTAPTHLAPPSGGAVQAVSAFAPADVDPPEVRVVVQRAPGAAPEVSQRGAMLALELPRPAPPKQGLVLGRGEVDLAELVRRVGEATGERFVSDGELTGRVGLELSEPLDHDEALDLLQAALLVNGRTALPGPGGTWQVVPLLETPQRAPLAEPDAVRSAPVTTLVPLRAADPGAVLTALRPEIGAEGLAMEHRPSGSLILAGPGPRVRRWRAIAQALDHAAEEPVWVHRLRHRGSDEMAPLLDQLADWERVPVRVVSDPRSAALVVRTRPDQVPHLRGLIRRLDEPTRGAGTIRVLPILHTDPKELADKLRSLSAGGGGGEPGAPGEELRGRSLAVAVDAATHSLVVEADPATQAIVAGLVEELDRPAPRMVVEVVVMEVTTSDDLSLGFDAFLPLTEPSSPQDWISFLHSNPTGQPLFGSTLPATQGVARFARTPLMIPIVNAMGVPVVAMIPRDTFQVTAQGSTVRGRMLLHPRIMAASGEEHELFAGDEVPIPKAATQPTAVSGAVSSGQSPITTNETVDRRDVGLKLRVKPSLAQSGTVVLELSLETSRVAPSLAGDVNEVGPTLSQRHLETRVRLDDERWAVLAMGPESTMETVDNGIPWLKRIPAFGWLFRATQDMGARRELLIAAHVDVLDPPLAAR